MGVQYDAKVIEGKYKGCYLWAWTNSDDCFSIHIGASNYFRLSADTVVDTQYMGSVSHNADPTDVLKAGFWFGGAAAVAASQLGKGETHTVAVEYASGERSQLVLFNSKAFQAFKKLEFAVDEAKRNKQKESKETLIPAAQQIVKRQILINTDNIQASIKRAFLFLEDEDWENADEYFESILDIDPECGEAYLGKLLVELKLPAREGLGNLKEFPADSKWYKRVIRFGSSELLDELQGYKNKIKHKAETEKRLVEQKAEEEKQIAQQKIQEERLQEEKKLEPYKPFVIFSKEEQLYQLAAKTAEKKTLYSFNKAKYLFESLNHYKDSEQKAIQCKNAIDEIQRTKHEDNNAFIEARNISANPSFFRLNLQLRKLNLCKKKIWNLKHAILSSKKPS